MCEANQKGEGGRSLDLPTSILDAVAVKPMVAAQAKATTSEVMTRVPAVDSVLL